MNFSAILLQAASNSAASGKNGTTSYIILMVVLLAVMYFMMIRPQKKRQKEEQEMRSSLEIGDEIITIGGIVGKVVTIREEDIVIETGADRTKMKIQRWAINTNVTKTEQHKKEVEAAREAAKDKKNKKKNDSTKSDTAKAAEEKIEK
ncbi:MAG: preprotein translocase subunit YajC [Oscillospiraceae bacterium]|nr:preprotein translocase subunit YajC [Oscillospiraceae bacterium]